MPTSINLDTNPELPREPRWLLVVKLIIAVLFPNVGGAIGAVFTRDGINAWYTTLEKPSWTPPNWLFAPMWVILYCLMGLASYLVYRFGGGLKGPAKWCLLIYLTNIFLNWSWSPVFFNAENILAGFIIILLVLATAILETVAFGLVSWIAGVLILPYVVWLVIATSLNGWIYLNN